MLLRSIPLHSPPHHWITSNQLSFSITSPKHRPSSQLRVHHLLFTHSYLTTIYWPSQYHTLSHRYEGLRDLLLFNAFSIKKFRLMPGNQAKNNGEPTETRGRIAVDILQKIVESNTALEVGLVRDIDTDMQLQFRTYGPPKFLLTKKCYATRKAGLVNFIVRDSRIAILFIYTKCFFSFSTSQT